MSVTLQFKLTQAGQQAIWNATNTGVSLNITHVQAGNGNKTPTGTETALVSPKQSTPIAAGFSVSPTQIRMSAIFGTASSFSINEIGLWAGTPDAPGSTLVGYWSQASGTLAVKSPGIDFVFTHDMVMDTALTGGSLTILADSAQSAMLNMIMAHEAKADPHPQYVTEAEASAMIEARVGDYVVSTNAGNAYTAVLEPPITSYSSKTAFSFRANAGNTGPATMNAGGGVKDILRADGSLLSAGDIGPGSIVSVIYDPTVGAFRITALVASQVDGRILELAAPISHVGSGGSAHALATTSLDGFMSSSDKSKLDAIASGAAALGSTAGTALAASGAAGTATTAARSDHVHPLPANATTTAAGLLSAADKTKLDTVTTGAAAVGSVTPLMNGVAAVGTATTAARSDHVHPTDTTRAPISSPTFTGTPAAPTPVLGTSTTQLATTAFVVAQIANDAPTKTGGNASGTWGISVTGNAGTATKLATPRTLQTNLASSTGASFDGSADASPGVTGVLGVANGGTGATTAAAALAALGGVSLGSVTPLANGTAAVGTATTAARSDHVHPTDATRAPLASPAFTGTPTVPTAPAGTSTTQAASTAFVSASLGGYLPLTGGALTGGLREARVDLGAGSVIDVNAGNLFIKTITGATAFTVSNVPPAGTVATILLELTNGGAFTVSWMAGVKWDSGTAPTLTAAGVDLLGFFTSDGGTTWRGIVLSKDSK